MDEKECVVAINELLLEKLEAFTKYEIATDKMLSYEADDILELVEERQDISEKIDALDQKLRDLYHKSENELVQKAALNKINFGDCPKNLRSVFLNGQKIFAVISMISRKEQQVVSRVEELRDGFLEQIKQQNVGASSKAAKYYSASKPLGQNFSLFDSKY